MNEIEAEFSVNTLLFMSGANSKQAELRTASVKGAIRFWWRALNYARFGGDISDMKQAEDRLFGSIQGQASVRFQLTSVNVMPCEPDLFQNQHGLIYLGYGVIDRHGQLERPCFKKANFTLKLISRKEISEDMIDVIKLFGLVGSLGSRARKGFGSVTLERIKKKSSIGTDLLYEQQGDDYSKSLCAILNKFGVKNLSAIPKISAFSKNTQIDILVERNGVNASMTLLNEYGEQMQRFRSWGFKRSNGHKLPDGTSAEQNFQQDHDWFKDSDWRNTHPNFHPKRAIFGLPHNYFTAPDQSATVQPCGNFERRASPLFFHVHKMAENKYLGISIIIHSDFLPKGVQIDADGDDVEIDINNYKTISGFLRGKQGHRENKTDKDYFPDRKPLWPEEEKL